LRKYEALLISKLIILFTSLDIGIFYGSICSLLSEHYMGATLGCTTRQQHVSTSVPVNSDIFIKQCCTHEELDECVALQQLVWRQSNLQLMPRRSFLIAINAGGIALGAYRYHDNKPALVGFVLSFAGILPGKNADVYWHTEMLGVHPDARNQRIGRRLMLELRDNALIRNIKLLKYNFDPTETRNAYIYITSLGGIGRKYSANHYGMFLSPGNPNPFAGRLHMECWLDSLHTRRCLGLKMPNDPIIPTSKIVDEVVISAKMAEWKRTGDIRAINAYMAINEKLLTVLRGGSLFWDSVPNLMVPQFMSLGFLMQMSHNVKLYSLSGLPREPSNPNIDLM
jgi:predicted GNAT superfamily acetyltransferase